VKLSCSRAVRDEAVAKADFGLLAGRFVGIFIVLFLLPILWRRHRGGDFVQFVYDRHCEDELWPGCRD
jgi:hypothetical protein